MTRRPASRTVSGREMVRRARERLDAGWPSGLTVLTGDDTYHLDSAQKLLLGALVPADATDFALTVYGDERVALGTVVAAARSRGMFAPRRVVLVRDVDALDGDPDVLEAYGRQPPPDSFLLVRAPTLDRRRKLHKVLAGAPTVLAFDRSAAAGEREAVAEIRELAGERGLEVRRDVALFVLEICGGDLYAVVSELDKLAAWTEGEGGRPVSLEQARTLAAGTPQMTGWEIAQAVVARDAAGAVSAACRLLDAGEEPIRLLGGLAWYGRILLRAKAMEAEGRSPRAILNATRAWQLGDRLFSGLKRYSMAELMAFPYHLAEADRTFKSRGVDPGAVLVHCVRRLVAPGRAERA